MTQSTEVTLRLHRGYTEVTRHFGGAATDAATKAATDAATDAELVRLHAPGGEKPL